MIDDKTEMMLALRKAHSEGIVDRLVINTFERDVLVGGFLFTKEFGFSEDSDGCYIRGDESLYRINYSQVARLQYDALNNGACIYLRMTSGNRLEIHYYYQTEDDE